MANPEILAKVKLMLGIKDDTQNDLINFAIEAVEERVLHYINHEVMPAGLEKVFVLLVTSYYRAAGLGSSAAVPGAVTSVKRGDVTTSFAETKGTGSSAMFGLGGGEDGFFGWRSVLNEYRRLRR